MPRRIFKMIGVGLSIVYMLMWDAAHGGPGFGELGFIVFGVMTVRDFFVYLKTENFR